MVDVTRRNKLLGLPNNSESIDCQRFYGLSVDVLEILIAEGFIDLDENQNNSPTTEEFLEFMKKYPGVKAHGYVIGCDREDCRTTLEGLSFMGEVTFPMLVDFTEMCRFADEFVIGEDGLYSWWD